MLVNTESADFLTRYYIGFISQNIPIHNEKINVNLQSDFQALDELVVTGLKSSRVQRLKGKLTGSTIALNKKEKKRQDLAMVMKNQTSVEFKTKIPYTVLSNGENYKIELSKSKIPADYKYYCIPKLEQAAYLIAQVNNWDNYNLLEGEANLYFENTFVGKSILGVKYLNDTLELSLGKDKSIIVKREKLKEFTKKRLIGTNEVQERSYKIGIRNTKSLPINIIIKDQIPVSENNDIIVEGIEISKGKLNEESGEIIWDEKIKPNEQDEKILKYEVKHPRGKRLIVD